MTQIRDFKMTNIHPFLTICPRERLIILQILKDKGHRPNISHFNYSSFCPKSHLVWNTCYTKKTKKKTPFVGVYVPLTSVKVSQQERKSFYMMILSLFLGNACYLHVRGKTHAEVFPPWYHGRVFRHPPFE